MKLKDVAHPVETIARQPQWLTRPSLATRPSRMTWSGVSLLVRVVLEYRGNPVGDGAGDAEEHHGHEAVTDVVVERRGVDRADHKKVTGARRESHFGAGPAPSAGTAPR